MAKKSKQLIYAIIILFIVTAFAVFWMKTDPMGQRVMEWLFPTGIAR